jgi:hypothetical protein
MRVSQKPNRTRGRGSRKPSNGGHNVNRVYESSGPEGKVRGTPQQIIEKYLSLARDAQTSGHRVVAENFLQHAEHYQRILVEAMGERQERSDSQQPGMERPSTDQRDEPQTEADSEAAAAPGSGSGRQPRDGAKQGDSRVNNRGEGRRDDQDPRESEVSGLTMIDSGQGDNGSLLVDAEELGASQPRRRPRRRDQEPAEVPAPAEADAPQPE